MQQLSRFPLVAALAITLTGCATFQRKPIVEQEVLRDLQAIRLEALGPKAEAEGAAPLVFDATDGLTADEAVAVALFLNPDLRAFRKERGVAEGELISARLLSNPELEVTWLKIEHFTKSLRSSGFDVGLNWAPPRPGERGTKLAKAQARIEEVRAQVEAEEWRLAADTRKAHAALWAAEERLRLAEASLKLQDRFRTFVRQKRELGDASRLDVNLVEIEYAETLREREAITNERDRARQELNRVLGLPPLYELQLQVTAEQFAVKTFPLAPTALETAMVEHRPDLLAAKKEYEQAEQELRLAYIQRWPWFQFGPAYARDELEGQPGNRWGFGVGVDLPIANLNQGEIARLEAKREKLREAFTAKLHAARAEMNEAYRNLRAQERLIRLFQESIRPALDENVQLTEAGLQTGEFNLVQLITTQDKVLKSRRESLEAQLDYWKAAFDLERAVGARLAEIETRKE